MRSISYSISYNGREPVAAVLAKTEAAVRRGVSSFWLPCHLFERDPVSTASVLLSRYPGIEITLVALSPYLMHPAYIAMAAGTISEFFPGRVSLCLGAGAPVDYTSIGNERKHPLGTITETIDICRLLFAGEKVQFKGKYFQINDRALGSGQQDVPILIAASGPKMLQLAGARADGVVLSAGACVEFIKWSLEHVARGRGAGKFTSHAYVYGAVDDDQKAAYDLVRGLLATTLCGRHHARNLELAGSRLDQEAVARAITSDDKALAESYIGDNIVARHAAAGTPELFRSRIDDYAKAGIDNIVLSSMRTPEHIDSVFSAVQA